METQEETADEYIHAVVVKKPITIGLARKHAQKYIRNQSKRFVRETADAYWFRCIAASNLKALRQVTIDDKIYLIVGQIK